MSFATILLLSLSGLPAWADDLLHEEPPPIGLQEGEPAPFAGQLLSPFRAIMLGQLAERCQFMRQADAAMAMRAVQIDTDLATKELQIALYAEQKKMALLEESLSRPWYQEPWFVAIVAAVGTYGLIRGAKALP